LRIAARASGSASAVHAELFKSLAQRPGLLAPLGREVALTGAIAKPARVDLALVRRGVAQEDDCAAPLHRFDQLLRRRLGGSGMRQRCGEQQRKQDRRQAHGRYRGGCGRCLPMRGAGRGFA
jgi:hypothetical protein